MKNQTQKLSSNLKKSVLSVMILSAVTGGLVLLEDYRSSKEAMQYSEHLSSYSVPVKTDSNKTQQVIFFKAAQDNSLLTTDVNELAAIAEQNLFVEEQFIVESEAKTYAVLKTESAEKVNIEKAIAINEPTQQFETGKVLFALSSSVIEPEYKLALLDMADSIKRQSSDKKWQVIGNTDKSGRASYNLSLAKQRAENVASFLISQGVDQQQLVLVTLGEHEAMQLTASTYNHGLRKVQVIEYKPGLDKLAASIKKRTEKSEKRLLAKKQQQLTASSALIKTPSNIIDENTDTVQVNKGLALYDTDIFQHQTTGNASTRNIAIDSVATESTTTDSATINSTTINNSAAGNTIKENTVTDNTANISDHYSEAQTDIKESEVDDELFNQALVSEINQEKVFLQNDAVTSSKSNKTKQSLFSMLSYPL